MSKVSECLLIEVGINNIFGAGVTSKNHHAFREALRDKLGINEHLAYRNVWQLNKGNIHCEYYLTEHADTAPNIIFLPGIGTYSELYAELLQKISSYGFNVYSFDLPGHGYSKGSRGRYTIDEIVKLSSELIDNIEQSGYHGKVGVLGYSVGSLLGVALAEADTRVKSLLCGTLLLPDVPPDSFHDLGWWWTRWNSLLFPLATVPLNTFMDFKTLLKAHPAGELINDDPLIVLDYPVTTLSSIFSYHAKLTKQALDLPIAIIHGDRDEVLPLEYTQRVVSNVAHPITVIPVTAAGHMMPWVNTDVLVAHATRWFEALA